MHQKLDMLGIGADHKNSAEGIAWKQNKDFENLLRRLNAANGADGEDEPMKVDGFVRPSAQKEQAKEDAAAAAEEGEEKKSKKKRKKGAEEDGDGEKKKRRKESKSSEDQESDTERSSKKDKKKKKRDAEVSSVSASTPATSVSSPAPVTASTSSTPAPTRQYVASFLYFPWNSLSTTLSPRAAFRGRHMASKNLASKSASAIAEILGISDTPTPLSGPSSAPTTYPSTPYEPRPSTSASSSGIATPAEELKLQELSVSSKSVMDYFKEKLAAKSNARVFSAPSSASTPREEASADDYDEQPRMGLGASRLRAEEPAPEERRGLGGIGSGMRAQFAAMFAPAAVSSPTAEPEAPTEAMVAADADADIDEDEDKKPKKSKKKEKERKKEKKSKKDKGKGRAEEAVEDVETGGEPDVEDAEAERKQRKEKRRRKEVEVQEATGADTESGAIGGGGKERKRKKEKKSKEER